MGGWLGFIGSAFSWLGGDSILASLTRVAVGIGIMRYLNKSTQTAQGSESTSTAQGVRQQVPPATENKIPVAYGDSYFSGTIIDVRLTNSNKEMYAVLALCEKTGDIFSTSPSNPGSRTASNITIDDIYLNNQKITFNSDGTTINYTTDDTGVQDTNAKDLVGIYLYKGDSNSPMLPCVTGTTTPIPGTVPPVAYEVMSGWGASHTCQNIIFAIVKMNYDPAKGLRSIPNLKFHVRNTLNKPGDVLHDYMTNEMYGGAIPEDMIDNATFTSLNSYSNESVTYTPYPAQSRYRINGLIRTTESVMSNMERIAGAAGSYITYDVSSGKWGIIINRVTAKTLDFNDSNIIGQVAITGTALENYYNGVEVQFPYSYLRDQSNFIRIDLPEIYRNENEPDNMLQISHELVNNVVQASLLGNLELRQSREDISIVFSTDFSKFNTQVGDVLGITNEVYGWTNKLFRVIRMRKNESEDGRLTIEITALAYNADVYTVEPISDFIPLIGAGYSIPSLGPIARPNAPIVYTGALISSQPSIYLTGTVPTGVVTEMEFWYSADTNPNDNLRNYILLGTMRAENSGPFLTGATTTFKTVLLQSGNYYFKVRAANQYGTSLFSLPSAATPYTYIQAPDVLPYSIPTVDANGDSFEQDGDGLNLGMLAMYVASKLNWGDILSGNISDIGDIFGVSSDNVEAVKQSVAADAANSAGLYTPAFDKALVGGETITATNSKNLRFTAGNNIVLTTNVGNNEIIIASTCCTEGNVTPPGPTTVCSELVGKVFPMIFGSGPTHGAVDSRAGIFTHDHLVFSGATKPGLKSTNVVNFAANLSANVCGQISNFYNFPSLTSGSWSRKPWYDETKTDKYEYGANVAVYYSTATYTSGNLDQQSWSSWKRINSNDGVSGQKGLITTTTPAVWANVYTNPPPTVGSITSEPYVVDEQHTCLGRNQHDYVDPDWPTVETDAYANYDPFKPNVLQSKLVTPESSTTTYVDTKVKSLQLCTGTGGNEIPFAGGPSDLIIFGVSVFNAPDNTPFSNNTVFGHVDDYFINTYPYAVTFRMIANNGSTYVGISTQGGKVYYSSDAKNWERVKTPSQVTEKDEWVDVGNPFRFIIWDGSKFLIYNSSTKVATSTNGINWSEYDSTVALDDLTSMVIKGGSNYIAVGINGIQTSSNGITWSAITLPAQFGARGPTCGLWDGSKYIVGGRFNNGDGDAISTSPDGVTWTALPNLSNPDASQTISDSDNIALTAATELENSAFIGSLL